VGVAQQGERAVADQIRGGLVAGDEQQEDRRDELVMAQRLTRLLGGDQRREQVVLGRALPFGDQPVEVVDQRVGGVVGGGNAFRRTHRRGVESGAQRGRLA